MSEPHPEHIGRYTIAGRLGEGGIGEVFEAVLNGPGGFRKRVALKRIKRDRPDLDHTLLHEARLGALLSHPNIVSTLDLTGTDEGWVIAMELVNGPTLWTFRHEGPVSAMALLDVGVQTAVALAHVHELVVAGRTAGLIHRDVKPSNLLLDPNGLVKLADLGLAALLESPDGKVVGTPGFAAPEQLQGNPEPRSDLFSLGVVLLWLATGELPFGEGMPANDLVMDAEAHLERTGLMDTVAAQVPGIAAVLERLLREDPAERFDSARQLVAALQALRPLCPDGDSLAETLAQRSGTEHVGLQLTPGGSPPVQVASNLPEPDSPLVGRASAITDLGRALQQARVVGLFGPPGVGKTAVAEEVGRRALPDCPGGVWRVDLGHADDHVGICSAIGATLSVPVASTSAAGQLGSALAARGTMLVLVDHPEHAMEPLTQVVKELVTRAPKLRLLLCSRRRLDVAGAQLLLGPLTSSESVDLFRQRRGRLPDAEEEGIERSLVAALDGLPLSIELAAARATFLPLKQVLASLQTRFRLLGAQTEGRSSTLSTALDLSWNQLSRPLRTALSQLAVFRGGFSLDAASAVVDLGDAAPWALDLLHQLSDHSLVQVDPKTGRFELLGVVRDYATQQLSERGLRAAQKRHGDYFSGLAHRFDSLRDGPSPTGALAVFALERWNLTVAVQHAIERGDREVAVSTARCAAVAWTTTGPVGRSRELLEAVLAMGSLSPTHEALLRIQLASSCVDLGTHDDARDNAEQAVTLARSTEDPFLVALALKTLGTTLRYGGEPHAALIHLEESRGLASRLGHRVLHARALMDLGMVNNAVGRFDDAYTCLTSALSLHEATGSPRDRQIALNTLGIVQARRGEPALDTFRQSLALALSLGDESTEGRVRQNLATQLLSRGQFDKALLHQRRAVEIVGRHGAVPVWITACGNLGAMLVETGDLERARMVLEQAISVARSSNLERHASTAFANLGRVHMLEENTAAALENVQQAIAMEQASGEVPYVQRFTLLLAMVHRYEGDLDPAMRFATSVYNWATRNEPNLSADALVELSRIRVAQRQGPEALKLVNSALEIIETDPLTPQAMLALGVKAAALLTCGDRQSGEEVLVRAELRARELNVTQQSAVGRQLTRIRNAFS